MDGVRDRETEAGALDRIWFRTPPHRGPCENLFPCQKGAHFCDGIHISSSSLAVMNKQCEQQGSPAMFECFPRIATTTLLRSYLYRCIIFLLRTSRYVKHVFISWYIQISCRWCTLLIKYPSGPYLGVKFCLLSLPVWFPRLNGLLVEPPCTQLLAGWDHLQRIFSLPHSNWKNTKRRMRSKRRRFRISSGPGID